MIPSDLFDRGNYPEQKKQLSGSGRAHWDARQTAVISNLKPLRKRRSVNIPPPFKHHCMPLSRPLPNLTARAHVRTQTAIFESACRWGASVAVRGSHCAAGIGCQGRFLVSNPPVSAALPPPAAPPLQWHASSLVHTARPPLLHSTPSLPLRYDHARDREERRTDWEKRQQRSVMRDPQVCFDSSDSSVVRTYRSKRDDFYDINSSLARMTRDDPPPPLAEAPFCFHIYMQTRAPLKPKQLALRATL